MKILLAEDEAQLNRVLTLAMKSTGYEVDSVADGQAAVDHAKENAYDVMIFDIMMPKKSGLDALKEIRATGDRTYVIMLTALSEVDDKVDGLDAGADDYITKPFSLKELLARLRSLERRFEGMDEDVLDFGDLKVDTNQQMMESTNSISLSSKESRLLQYLILNANKDISINDLMNHTWDDDDETADHGDVWFTVSYLRRKLASIGSQVTILGDKTGPFKLTQQ